MTKNNFAFCSKAFPPAAFENILKICGDHDLFLANALVADQENDFENHSGRESDLQKTIVFKECGIKVTDRISLFVVATVVFKEIRTVKNLRGNKSHR